MGCGCGCGCLSGLPRVVRDGARAHTMHVLYMCVLHRGVRYAGVESGYGIRYLAERGINMYVSSAATSEPAPLPDWVRPMPHHNERLTPDSGIQVDGVNRSPKP